MGEEIVRLAAPVIAGMISYTVLNVVDTAMVGRLGDTALAAVGLGSYFCFVIAMIFGSLSIGTQAVTSRRLGEKRTDEFGRIYHNASLLAFVIGIVVSIAGYAATHRIFSLLSDEPAVVRVGTPYLEIRMVGVFAMVAIFTMRGFVYGIARPRIDMVVSVIINMLNIVLNYFLIFGHWIFPRLEVKGAALASLISTVVGLIVYIIFVQRGILRDLPHRFHPREISGSLMTLITRISAPRALQSVSMIGFVIFLSLMGRIGLRELAISNIIYKAFNLSFMIGLGVGTASATLVGRSLGERNEQLAVRYGWHSVGIGSILMGIVGTAFMFFPREIMGIFSDQPETIERGILPFRLLGAFQFIDGVGIILSRTLQGVGSTLYVMVSEMICIWCLLIPYTYITVVILDTGLVAAWWGLFLYILAFMAAMTWKFREGGWKSVRI
jgi:putative MATE family efflux protein